MKRNELFPAKWVNAADVIDKPVVVKIARVTREILRGPNGNQDKGVVHFVGAAKALVLNVTNYNSIADIYGDETEKWPGCRIELYADKTPMDGKMVTASGSAAPRPSRSRRCRRFRTTTAPSRSS